MSKKMKILVTGVKGQLGYDCVRELTESIYCTPSDYTRFITVERTVF